MAPGLSASIIVLLKTDRSAAATGFDDHVAVRQLGPHARRPALGMMSPPSIVVTMIDVFANHDVVTITVMDDNLRGHRYGACKHSTNGRT
jgi:hypothetical protein